MTDVDNFWPANPTSDKVHDFIFLTVDVIDSSNLFWDDMPDDELQENAEAMNAVYVHVRAALGLEQESPWEWNWAGDGGVFAFLTSVPGTFERVFKSAKEIACLPSYALSNGNSLSLQLRIVIHRGQAYFREQKGLRRSAALNAASKLRVPGKRTSLTVTDEVRKKLHDRDRTDVFRAIPLGPQQRAKVYGYVPLMRDALEAEIAAEKVRDKAQAAHLAYRLGTLSLSTGDRVSAARAFRQAKGFVATVGPKHRYYWRTLYEFYGLWEIVAVGASDELLREANKTDWLSLMRESFAWEMFTNKHGPRSKWRLLVLLELIMEQLDVLAGQPVNDPVGLTGLEVCLLLERFGYARRWYGTALSDRLDRIEEEMGEEGHDHAIDEGCTMCSGVAASCLILDDRTEADRLVEWLRGRQEERFCYRHVDSFADAAPHEHAVHYAASVLQAFLDHGRANEIYIDKAREVFFDDDDFKEGSFPASWRKWRNTTVYDFCTYVFPTFARYILAPVDSLDIGHYGLNSADTFDPAKALEKHQVEILSRTLQSLAIHLREDAKSALLQVPQRGRLYGARENVGSFALGLLIGLPAEAVEILKYNLARFAAYAERKGSEARRHRTIDSSIDRSRKMVEGWILQVECALYLRSHKLPIPEWIVQWLGIDAASGEMQ